MSTALSGETTTETKPTTKESRLSPNSTSSDGSFDTDPSMASTKLACRSGIFNLKFEEMWYQMLTRAATRASSVAGAENPCFFLGNSVFLAACQTSRTANGVPWRRR